MNEYVCAVKKLENESSMHAWYNSLESAQKFMQVEVNVKCMHTNFGGCGISSFGDIATFLATFPFQNMDYIVHGSEKLSRLELALAQLYHGYTLQWKNEIKSCILSAMPTLSSV